MRPLSHDHAGTADDRGRRGPARRARPEAARRLTAENLADVRAAVLEPLGEIVLRASSGPTSTAIALFASQSTTEIIHLPLPVVDRVVVDPTFATRDLVRSVHRTPRHLVLALSRTEARLFDGIADDLRPAQTRAFPRTASALPATEDPRRAPEAEQQWTFLRGVDAALGSYLRLHPAPLAQVVSTDRVLADFQLSPATRPDWRLSSAGAW